MSVTMGYQRCACHQCRRQVRVPASPWGLGLGRWLSDWLQSRRFLRRGMSGTVSRAKGWQSIRLSRRLRLRTSMSGEVTQPKLFLRFSRVTLALANRPLTKGLWRADTAPLPLTDNFTIIVR